VPETITVGDYLLTPDCAVERKAIPDLIQSLNSGRLYTQAEALCRAYKNPVLLIEFDESRRAFSLLGLGDLRTEISGSDLMSRLCLLLLHFPKLKVIWSSSLLSTAEIFGDLQRDQPDPISPTGDIDLTISAETSYSVTPKAMLEALPGVNQQNLFKLMNSCTSMRDLCNKDLEDLMDIMGPANGKVLFDFVHKKF
jgi:DNA excision repair protein ERCC-4